MRTIIGRFCLAGILGGAFLFGVSPQEKPIPTSPPSWRVPDSASSLKNPYAGQTNHIQAGEKLVGRYCASCHGRKSEGKGRAPALLTDRIRKVHPGHLYWFIRNGNGKSGMPGWSRLPDQQIWQIVTYLQNP